MQQAFPPGLDDEDYMDDLFVSVELAPNAVLVKVNVDEILQACLDP